MADWSAEEWRAYRARRKARQNPVPSGATKTAEHHKAYRQTRKEQGRAVVSSAIKYREFVAWDGEGITDGKQTKGLMPSAYALAVRTAKAHCAVSRGSRDALASAIERIPRAVPAPHRYVMLANSRGACIESPLGGGLGTQACLDALVEGGSAHPKAIHVVFGGSYDATMILHQLSGEGPGVLRGLPDKVSSDGRAAIAAIMKNQTQHGVWVYLGDRCYSIMYRQRKFLRVGRFRDARRPFTRDPKTGKNTPDYDAKITLWDVIGFFQATFVKACADYGIEADLQAIGAMKERRSRFRDRDRKRMRAYCIDECVALEKLALKLAGCFDGAGLHLARWDGAGAGAGALLRREKIKDHIVQEPLHLAGPVACAFFGGRIEIMQIGRAHMPIYGYDIASAYPWAMQGLPSLHGTWHRVKELPRDPGAFCLARVRWELTNGRTWYPLPYRNPQGTIVFPSEGEGWYWLPEVLQAQAFAARLGGRIELLSCWVFRPDSHVKPFAFIAEVYAKRQEWKRTGFGGQMAYKLSLNSLFGKAAQQVGAVIERGKLVRLPPYFNLGWAGYITSTTRARLVEAGLKAPRKIVAFATDGIYATEALDIPTTLPAKQCPWSRPPLLGEWEGPSIAQDAVFVQAGVYWTLSAKGWKARYRGFDRKRMESPEIALRAWKRKRKRVDVPTTRFVTYGSALCGDDAWAWRGTWRSAPRALDLTGKGPKRLGFVEDPTFRGKPYRGPWPHEQLVPLAPEVNRIYQATGQASLAYKSVTLKRDLIDGVFESEFTEEAAESEYI